MTILMDADGCPVDAGTDVRLAGIGDFDKLRYIQIARHRVSQTVTSPHKNVRIISVHNAPNCVVAVKSQGLAGRILVVYLGLRIVDRRKDHIKRAANQK